MIELFIAQVLAASLILSPAAATPTLSEFFRDNRWAIAGIVSGKPDGKGGFEVAAKFGSGFLVDQKCTVVTATHVVRAIPAALLHVRFRLPDDPTKASYLPATVIYQDRDVTFLQAYVRGRPTCSSKPIAPLRLVDADAVGVEPGAEVFIAGFPRLEDTAIFDVPVVRDGVIAATELRPGNQPMLLLDLTGIPGFSGAPVVERSSGRVIGVIYGPGKTDREFGMEWATPITAADYDAAMKAQAAAKSK